MNIRTPRHLLASFLLLYSTSLSFGNQPEAPAPPKVEKKSVAQLQEELKQAIQAKDQLQQYRIIGQIFAIEPQRIPEELPGAVRGAASFKAAQMHLANLLTPTADECVPVLIKMLTSDEKDAVFPATMGLSAILPTARPALEELLAKGKTKHRLAACRLLGEAGAVPSTVAALTAVLQDPESELRVQAALALINVKAPGDAARQVLAADFDKEADAIMWEVLRNSPNEAYRDVLERALAQKENRLWRIESALQLEQLNKKLTAAIHAALVEGLARQERDATSMAEKCAALLGEHPEFAKESLPALTVICEKEGASALGAEASAAVVRLDPKQASIRLPALVETISQPRYSSQKVKYLRLIYKLGAAANCLEKPLRELLGREGEACRILVAMILLQIDAAHPEDAHAFLRLALQGKAKGTIGMAQLGEPRLDLTALVPDLQAAIKSDDAARSRLALHLLRLGDASAQALIPDLEAKIVTLEKTDKDAMQDVINSIHAGTGLNGAAQKP